MASLNLRAGVLGKRLSAHLLRRASFNYSPARIESFAAKTADQAVEDLFVVPPLTHPEGPKNWEDGGTAWLTTGPLESRPASAGQRRRAVNFWFWNELMQDTSIRHKMALYFHSIFITEADNDWRMFDYWRLFQYYALGNIKTLTNKVTLDNKMLRYLNNNQNTRYRPNENYAREFFELFTILKGEQIGEGDYTNYTEHDIVQASRVLSGFRNNTYDVKDPATGLATGYARFSHHDPGNKTFSKAFGHTTITGATDAADMHRELADFVDMVFEPKETARAFCRRLYHFFVSDIINDEIERDIIEPLAEQLRSDNYDVSNTVKKLLKSVHFYDEDDNSSSDEIIGGKIKSGLNLYLTSVKFFDAGSSNDLSADPLQYKNTAARVVTQIVVPAGFTEYPLSVEGYPGFYKSPAYSEYWFDQTNIGHRYRIADALLMGRTLLNNNAVPYKLDVIQFFNQNFSNQEYSDQLVRQFLEYVLPEMPDAPRVAYFENKLLDGLSPINWFFEWQNYKKTGDSTSVEVVLKNFLEAVMNSPEYQTF